MGPTDSLSSANSLAVTYSGPRNTSIVKVGRHLDRTADLANIIFDLLCSRGTRDPHRCPSRNRRWRWADGSPLGFRVLDKDEWGPCLRTATGGRGPRSRANTPHRVGRPVGGAHRSSQRRSREGVVSSPLRCCAAGAKLLCRARGSGGHPRREADRL